MTVKLLVKTTLKFWQEIVFVIPIGFFLIVLLIDVFNGRFGMFDDLLCIATVCFHVIIFICLVGQFFWKNETLGVILTPFLLLYSLFLIFAYYAMPKDNPNDHLRHVLLIGALFLVFAVISMWRKYSRNNSLVREPENN